MDGSNYLLIVESCFEKYPFLLDVFYYHKTAGLEI